MWTGETTHIRFVWTRFSLKTEIWIHVDRTKDNSSLNRRPSINIYLPCMNDECLQEPYIYGSWCLRILDFTIQQNDRAQ